MPRTEADEHHASDLQVREALDRQEEQSVLRLSLRPPRTTVVASGSRHQNMRDQGHAVSPTISREVGLMSANSFA
jgi:hypothetical protein